MIDFEKARFKRIYNKYKPVETALAEAKEKHPNWPENIFEQLAILQEEAGEITKAVLHYKRENGSLPELKKEIFQTAAMCMRFLEHL